MSIVELPTRLGLLGTHVAGLIEKIARHCENADEAKTALIELGDIAVGSGTELERIISTRLMTLNQTLDAGLALVAESIREAGGRG